MSRPTKHNLHRDGHDQCADFAAGAINRAKGCHSVYVAPDGSLRVIPDATKRQWHRPDPERIGRYRRPVQPEQMKDDLIAWLRDNAALAA